MTSPPLLVSGSGVFSLASRPRPANATPYGVGSVVGGAGAAGGVWELPLIGPAGSVGEIRTVQIRMAGTSLPAGMAGGFRVHLFNAQPANVADGAAFATATTEMGSYIDYVDVPILELIGGGFLSRSANYAGIPFRLITTSLWAEVVTASGNGFTPVSGVAIDLVLRGVLFSSPT